MEGMTITKPTPAERAAAQVALDAATAELAAIEQARAELDARSKAAWNAARAAKEQRADIDARDKLSKLPADVIDLLRAPLGREPAATLIRRKFAARPYYGAPIWTDEGKRLRRLLGVVV